jgi:hypothetical protein
MSEAPVSPESWRSPLDDFAAYWRLRRSARWPTEIVEILRVDSDVHAFLVDVGTPLGRIVADIDGVHPSLIARLPHRRAIVKPLESGVVC